MKLGRNQLEILLEALRRYSRFGYKKSITQAWTGLGSASVYKSCADAGLMTIATSPNPKYSTWWRLTEKGAKVRAMLSMGYDYKSVENGWHEKGLYHNGAVAISPESFFANETTNRATFDEKKGEFVL